jgi:CheY-specific phosphatase CheX
MTAKQANLVEVISNVIENLSMMPVEVPTEWENFTPQLEGWIEFIGPVKGKLFLRCEEALALALAENLLGTDNTDIQIQADAWDALAELLNVVCGNLVTELFDSKKPFTLSPPQINVITPIHSDDIKNKEEAKVVEPGTEIQTVRILLDGHPIELILEEKKL